MLNTMPADLAFRFRARELQLVMGPGANGKPTRFRVERDSAESGQNRGVDVGADGVHVYSFTFG